MILLLSIFAFLNVFFIVSYIIGQYFIFEKNRAPKIVAYYALLITALLFFYFVVTAIILLFALIKHDYYVIPLLIPVCLTLLVGRYSSYAKLKLYENLQLGILFFSLFYTLFLLMKDF